MNYWCHRHGAQEKRPCPECRRATAQDRKPRVRGSVGQALRYATLAIFDHRCAAVTGEGSRCDVRAPLEVHHLDGDPSNDLPSNRVPLCLAHHQTLPLSYAPPTTPFVA